MSYQKSLQWLRFSNDSDIYSFVDEQNEFLRLIIIPTSHWHTLIPLRLQNRMECTVRLFSNHLCVSSGIWVIFTTVLWMYFNLGTQYLIAECWNCHVKPSSTRYYLIDINKAYTILRQNANRNAIEWFKPICMHYLPICWLNMHDLLHIRINCTYYCLFSTSHSLIWIQSSVKAGFFGHPLTSCHINCTCLISHPKRYD